MTGAVQGAANDSAADTASLNSPPAKLRLYIAGGTPNSVRAQANLDAALKVLSRSDRKFVVELVDVFIEPHRALIDRVIVTPTLLVILMNVSRTMVGDLGNPEELARLLETATEAQKVGG